MSTVGSITRRLLLAGAVTISMGLGAITTTTAADEAVIRVLSVDGDTGALTVLDGRSGEVTGTFETGIPGAAFATGSDSGEYFLVNYYQGGQTLVIDSGLFLEPHGDHSHLIESEPAIEMTLEGGAPAHYWAHDGLLAVVDDSAGIVTVMREGESGTVEEPTVIELATGPDHTSIAILNETLFTANYTGGEVQIYDLNGDLLNEDVATCNGAHGETALSDRVAFACNEGILLITESGETEWIAYPESAVTAATPEAAPAMRSNVLSASDGNTIVAGDSAAGVMLFDTATGTSSMVSLPAAAMYVQYNTSGDVVTALDANGTVHGIDPVSAEVIWSTDATVSFSTFSAEEANTFYPFLSNAAGLVFTANPGAGTIVAIDTASGEIVNEFEVGGRPARVATVTMSEAGH